MNKMELRTSRSRSKTPFLTQELIDKEVAAAGNHVEKTVVRTTRRTTVVKSNANASSSTDEINTSRDSSFLTNQAKSARRSAVKSDRSLRSQILKTSDYSSEDGENEVSSSKTVSQNERNQLIENARALVNGSEMPALELYKKSVRYWDVYPKTDWTYSQHSKDRVEIAPGVVAMPNMSRKTIHALDDLTQSYLSESNRSLYSENVAHKNASTETSFSSKYSNVVSEGVKRSLFNNNGEDYYIKRRKYTLWTSFTRTVTSIFTSIFMIFYYAFVTQTTIFSYIHWIASKVMLWDTYLLWKSRPGNKAKKLVLLCLLPLLLFGGLWFLSGLGGILYGAVTNYTSSAAAFVHSYNFWTAEDHAKQPGVNGGLESAGLELDVNKMSGYDIDVEANTIKKRSVEEKIIKVTEKVYMEPPTAEEIASSFSVEQIKAIAMLIKDSLELDGAKDINSDDLVEKIVQNPNFHSVVNKYYTENINYVKSTSKDSEDNSEKLNKHQVLIDSLLKEINNMKEDIIKSNKLRTEDYARLSLDIKKCCNKRPVINIEGYVTRIVTDLLNNPQFLQDQEGLNDWLRSMFIAKQHLEYHIGNLTSTVDAKMAALIHSNSQTIMDRVSAKLLDFSNKRQVHITSSSSSEDQIRQIVKDVLAIYDADKTGLVDYAMETMGGQIVTTRCTEPYHYGKAVVSVLGIPLWYPVNSPRTVIRPSIAPGECWAFQNFPGFVVIKLSNKIKVEAFSMEHISRLLVPDGRIDSAPKQFEVYGLVAENDRNPVLLGSYTYDYDGDPLQIFPVEKEGGIFDMIEIRVISNHGNPNYTCLYRFRVHGELHHEENR